MPSLSCYRSCTSKKAKKYCTEQETESVMLSQDKGLLFEEALGMFFIGNVVLLKTISSLFCPLKSILFYLCCIATDAYEYECDSA